MSATETAAAPAPAPTPTVASEPPTNSETRITEDETAKPTPGATPTAPETVIQTAEPTAAPVASRAPVTSAPESATTTESESPDVTTAAPASEPTSTTVTPPTETHIMNSTDTEPAVTTATPSTGAALEPAAPVVPTIAAAPTASLTNVPTAETKTEATTTETSKEELPEPQNTLTKRFTEAEWKALKEFRKDLAGVLADAYPDKADAKTTPITLWGVKIDPVNPVNAKVSVVLMKFLRARNLSVKDGRDLLVATLRWRDEFDVQAAMEEDFPEDVFGQLGHVYGKDKEGRPVIYNVYGGNQDLKAVFGDVERFLRWRVALMEKSVAQLDFETVDQTFQVHDYEGVSMSSRDANSKRAASEATSIFGAHYPELLYKKFFVNVPSYLTWIFWLFKPLMPAATLAKMSVVGYSPRTIGKALLPFIDSKELPKRYGGQADGF